MNKPMSSEFVQPKYTIEVPETDDAIELATMHNQSWLDTYPNDEAGVSLEYIKERVAGRLTEKGLTRRREYIERTITDSTYFLRIAKNEAGKIVGFIDGFLKDDKYELAGLYTDKDTHGTGLGLKLWETYQEWVDSSKVIWLTVVAYNDRAISFYKKIGFKELPETKRFYGETHIPVVDMERRSSLVS